MSRKIIAVVPLWDDKKQSIWMLPGYMDGIEAAGAIPVILPLSDSAESALEAFELCDGLLMTGGHDVSPALYGETPKKTCGAQCEKRDSMESALYKRALECGKPVLGICRGIQLINVLQGGTLYQDLPTERESCVEHQMKPPYSSVAHYVNIVKPSPLYELLQTERLGVNSYHHQAVKRLGSGLEVMAVSEDGLVEAVRCTESSFVWAVQWHPEFNFRTDPAAGKIFEAFVKACR
ncbi:MAG: gamma-glutamyl-gamma-aminobutyrate hydrolase family protein [Oscillospiraceae bacterium]|nr:gamma-glutamyl-gamma-aminobutyrate hydrolase family protein [Oscillospiraceae bacterium]